MQAAKDARYVFNLAADMGGMGFIELHKAECMLSVLINTHLLIGGPGRGTRSDSSFRPRHASTRRRSRHRQRSFPLART